MAFQGFGKNSGPSAPPSAQTPFGHFPRPRAPSPTPPLSSFPRQPSLRVLEAPDSTHSPPLAFERNHSVLGPSAGGYSSSPLAFESNQSVLEPSYPSARGYSSPPLAFERNHSVLGPSAGGYSSSPLAFERIHSVLGAPYPSARGPTESPPAWGDRQNSFFKDYNAQTQQRPAGASFVASHNFRAGVPAQISQFQELERTRSPPLRSPDGHVSRNSRTAIGSRSELLSNNRSQPVPHRSRSPPFALENNAVKDFGNFVEVKGPDISPPAWANQQKLPGNFANSQPLQDQFSVSPYIGTYDSAKSFPTKRADYQVQKRTRSPPLLSANEVSQKSPHFSPNDSKRTSASSPSLRTMSNVVFNAPDSQIQRESLPSARITDDEAAATKATNIPVPKRTRSPPLSSTDQVFQGDYYSAQDDIERELQAKAKRLARFKVELSEPVPSTSGTGNQKVPANKSDQSMLESQNFRGEHSEDMLGDFPNGNVSSEFEAPESSRIISGLCPDMCPESERAERERKGDLDQYERVDGNRNQTRTSLAVKKYTRTAEREADLIRPMPVLQRTIDYLLNLLDQPYDEKLLGLYNFLWDRMRAIRMDLRMQHIFNLGAITMLEQMIRLHIIAMHELCEYTKGEGFSEGFDAHLNIEQMNKTSVELFQLYDDHRKKGIKVPSEKEFRGYYALLKLDKHPGYKVEPAELSLDLSKMTPEIRQTSEVLFARDVARACRTGNFVSFFRLARKASYLQACLMHAHFAKLRTQALASLHCGLQNNQGVPVTHVAKWLGMEEEDIENLLEYHGFSIKEFEEPYMVKDGPFLNSDNDYPVKCSELVHLKKSRRIVEDVSSPCLATEEIKELKTGGVYEQDVKPTTVVETDNSVQTIDEEMSDYDAVPSPKDTTHGKPMLKMVAEQSEAGDQVASVSPFSWDFSMVHSSPESQPPGIGSLGKPEYDTLFRNSLERNTHSSLQPVPLESMSRRVDQERFPGSQIDSAEENLPQTLLIEDGEEEEEELTEDEQHTAINQNAENDGIDRSNHDEEATEAKLRLILRIWKRRSSKIREIREQRQLAANAALDSLSLGPPIRHNKYQRSTHVEFDMDRAMKERYKKHVQSWSRLNVSEVIAGKLGVRNPKAKCLCWKIILHSQMDYPDRENMGAHLTPITWLLSKLMPTKKDDDMVISSPGLSIWKKWVPSQSGGGFTCCLSVIMDAKMNNLNESLSGANAVLFLVSESIPWDLQKIRLHNLIRSLPSGSCLPLLIVRGSYKEYPESSSTMLEKLNLHDIDKSRISNFLVVCLVKNQHSENFDEFFSDEKLREGLEWLASLSPLQPVLSCIKTRDLVLNHLNSSLEVLDEMGVYEVGPNHCISAFNEALDQSLREVATAAEANCVCWPCPEIALLEEFSDEHRAVKLYLPNTGWNSAARIQPLMCALRDCKLPTFPDDISWLYRGSNLGQDIKNQRLQLENCLIRYLTESSKMMGLELAAKEACVMLQNSARLELHDLTHYIVLNWVIIFRRVFNWLLMSLSNGQFSTAYILEQDDIHIPTSGGSDEFGLESSISSPYYVIHPSLDEMVDALMSPTDDSECEALQPPLMMLSNAGEVQKASDVGELIEERSNIEQDDKLAETSNDVHVVDKINGSGSELAVVTRAAKEAGKLSKLLEQCNLMQDMIDAKLSIYF